MPSGKSVHNPVFTIRRGESFLSITNRLEQEGFLRSSFFLRLILKLTRDDISIPAGTFTIPQERNVFQMIDVLKNLNSVSSKITIPEGLTSTQIANVLEKYNIVSAKDFLQATHSDSLAAKWKISQKQLEGYLFPDTYFFFFNSPAESVVDKMVETFFRKIKTITQETNPQKLNQMVILASIVEKEYRKEEEAPLIASVFLNRLKRNIGLYSCATIAYILTEKKGLPYPKKILFQHTQIPSPYNTYLYAGLPPGPISNPGLTSLKAVFQPASSDYLYFFLDDPQQGTHKFSQSFDAHNKARSEYLDRFSLKN